MMDSGQAFRRFARNLGAAAGDLLSRARGGAREASARVAQWAEKRKGPLSTFAGLSGRWRAGVIAVFALLVVYPLAAWWMSTIDDTPDFGADAKALRGSESLMIANMAALITREVDEHGWAPNDVFPSPTALLDNMPRYQEGIVSALARATAQIAGNDPELKEAARLFAYPPDVLVWRPSVSFWPASSESKYRAAANALRRYNARLAAIPSVKRNPRFLSKLLAGAAADMASLSASLDAYLDRGAGFFISSSADDLFYTAKGRMYGYYIVFKGAERDFGEAIRARGLALPWRQMMNSLRRGATLSPWIVLNGAPDSVLFPCPLCGQGFYLLRAQQQAQQLAAAIR